MTTDPKSVRPVGAVGSTPQTPGPLETWVDRHHVMRGTYCVSREDGGCDHDPSVIAREYDRLLTDCEAALLEVWRKYAPDEDGEYARAIEEGGEGTTVKVDMPCSTLKLVTDVLAAIDAMKAGA